MKRQPGDKIETMEVPFRCPCGQKIYVGVKDPAVVHAMPMCALFESLEPDKYLKAVRQHYQRLGLIPGNPND